jgi:elongator complex protein 2
LKGHQDWIRSLDFAIKEDGELLLATASQDNYIRIWNISSLPKTGEDKSSWLSSLQDQSNEDDDEEDDAQVNTSTKQLSSKGHLFTLGTTKYTILLESILIAHEDWVLSVRWHPPSNNNGFIQSFKCYLPLSC